MLLTFLEDLYTGQTTNYPDFQAITERQRPLLSLVSRVHYYTLGLSAYISLVELYLPLDMKSIFPLWPHDLREKKPSQYDLYLPWISCIRTITHCLAHMSMLDDGGMSHLL